MISTEKIFFIGFISGVLAYGIYNYSLNESKLRERIDYINSCSSVSELNNVHVIITLNGYWDDEGYKCVVYDQGVFRDLNSREELSRSAYYD